MNGRTNRWVKPFLVTTTLLLFTACASTQQEEDDSPWSDDMNQVARQLNLHRGCLPIYVTEGDVDAQVKHAVEFGKKNELFKSGSKVVIVNGATNTVNTM